MNEPDAARRLLKRSRAVAIAGRIGLQQTSRVRARLGRAAIGATHRGYDLDQSLAYIDAVYEDYLAYGLFDVAELDGARVLEVGAGDNFGVALRMLAAGAEQVVAVDRFATWRDPDQQRTIYTAMLERLDGAERERAESAVRLDGPEIVFDEARLRVVEGVPIEQAAELLGPGTFDLIVSRAVIEHVYDVDESFRAMDVMLRPGGAIAHKVDLSDHGLFTTGGHNPLTFLTVSDRLYDLMGGQAGLPNRRRAGDYREIMLGLGYDWRSLVTHVAGREEDIVPHVADPDPELMRPALELVEEVRPRLLPRFRDLPAAELAITGIFLAARKPAG